MSEKKEWTWQHRGGIPSKEKTITRAIKMDTVAVAKKIQEELEKQSTLPLEEKQRLAQEMFLKEKEGFQATTIATSGWMERPMAKTSKWWADLEKTRGGKMFKVATGSALIGGATLASAAFLGIGSSSILGVSARLISRVGIATGFNMGLTSKTSLEVMKYLDSLKKNKGKEGKNKILNFQNFAMLGGVGASFILSGGVFAVAGVAAGGFAGRKALNYFIDRRKKDLEEKISKHQLMYNNIDGSTFGVYALAGNLDEFEKGYDNLVKKLKRNKWGKNIMNGALTIGVGLGTMAADCACRN